MHQIKKLKIVLFVIVVLLILVIVRNTDQHLFKKEVKTAIEVAATNSNMITMNQLQKLSEPYLVIDLGSKVLSDSLHFQHSVQIPFEKLLDKPNRTILKEAKGTLILFSDDVSTASKAFIILNQLGFKNLKVLTLEENPEALKYKFQPNTKTRLEEDGM
jgi:hypothetical protein